MARELVKDFYGRILTRGNTLIGLIYAEKK